MVRADQPVILDGLLSYLGIPNLHVEEPADASARPPGGSPAQPRSIEELVRVYPELRPPVIHGLLRCGESANIIAPPKTGKSWLASDLAIAVASGRPWLDCFPTEPGDVLIIDNELHGETSANRVPRVAAARSVPWDEYKHGVFIENLRGKLRDIHAMAGYFQTLEPGRYQVIVLGLALRQSHMSGAGAKTSSADHADFAGIQQAFPAVKRGKMRVPTPRVATCRDGRARWADGIAKRPPAT